MIGVEVVDDYFVEAGPSHVSLEQERILGLRDKGQNLGACVTV